MEMLSDPIDRRLLDDWQRDFPVSPRPFADLAKALRTSEGDVIGRFERMRAEGRITRVGATCAPNTISASTLAAIAAPPDKIEAVATVINEEPGVNHSYEREDHWNLWFVATGPDRAYVDRALDRISERTGLRVLDLQLVRRFNTDLGFPMSGEVETRPRRLTRPADISALKPGDVSLVHELVNGLPLVARPFAHLADRLGVTEDRVIERINTLVDAYVICRLGVIVRHRALGWRANAMVVWDIESERISDAGPRLAAQPGITLCYERRPVEDAWPYRLYCMIHARSRDEALARLRGAEALPEFAGVPHKVLFSTRCFRQTGAMIAARPEQLA